MASKVVVKKSTASSAIADGMSSSRGVVKGAKETAGMMRAAAYTPSEQQKGAALRNLYFLLGILIGCTVTLSVAVKYSVSLQNLVPHLAAAVGNYSVASSSGNSNSSAAGALFLRKGGELLSSIHLFPSLQSRAAQTASTSTRGEGAAGVQHASAASGGLAAAGGMSSSPAATATATATGGYEGKKYEGMFFLAAADEQPAAASSPASKKGWVPGKAGLIDKYKEQIGDNSKSASPVATTPGTTADSRGRQEADMPPEGSAAAGAASSGTLEQLGDRKSVKRAKALKRKERSREEKGLKATATAAVSPARNVSSCCLGMFDERSGERLDESHILDSAARAVPHPPLRPYHSQATAAHPHTPPYAPSYELAVAQHNAIKEILASSDRLLPGTKIRLSDGVKAPPPLPNMAKQRAVFEKESLKTHLCNGVFEAYSASWLTTKHHVLHVKSDGYNLTWVNCEMASFIHMRESNNFYNNPTAEGMVMQSLDVLDFSVIHLSTYERSSKKYLRRLWKTRAEWSVEWSKIEPVKAAARALEERVNPLKTGRNLTYSPEALRTVVIMPFLGGAMGAGHSELGNRFEYLKACFWSFYEFIPNIVAGVSRKEDVEWAFKKSGLPFYDILLLEGLPKSASLPVGTTARTKLKLLSGEWDFDYVFFTESDQILISRQLPLMYDQLKTYPGRMLLPHRLMVYSDRIMEEVHSKKISKTPNEWMQQSCCLERQNCADRSTWKGITDPSVHVINYYGLYVPLGNVNYLQEHYRPCKIGPYEAGYCA